MKEFPRLNLNFRRIIECNQCKKQKEHHAKGACFNCYRRYVGKPPIVICKHCKRERPHKALGMCDSCHAKVTHYEGIKAHNYRKWYNISLELYKKVTQTCIVCGFEKAVNIHHLDHNKRNNLESNLIGLCPNHHKMIHDHRYSEEVCRMLESKGYKPKLTKF